MPKKPAAEEETGSREPGRTFKEDELAIVALVGRIDVIGQTDPEDRYGHGIVIQDPVPPHTPEPATLNGK